MFTAISLLLYAGVLGWGVDPALARSKWTHRSPALALLVWHALALGAIAGLLAGLYLLAHDAAEHGFARLLHADKERLHLAYASAGEVPAYWNISLTGVAIIVATLGAATATRLRLARRESLAHHLSVTRRHPIVLPDGRRECLGVTSSDVPAIYCVASGARRGRILVTTSAIDMLDQAHLHAAIDHECAHIRRRHHAMVLFAEIVSALAHPIGMLRHYPHQTRHLVELDADDAAARKNGRLTLAEALLQLSVPRSAPGGSHALESAGDDPGFRIRRLIARQETRLRRSVRCAACCVALALPLLPIAASLGPALMLTGTAHTPAQSPSGTISKIPHHS